MSPHADDTSKYKLAQAIGCVQAVLCRFKLAIVFVALLFAVDASDFGNAFAQSCTPPPSGLVAWYPGEGNANDIRGGNNGALQGGAGFVLGKVGQAFSLNGTAAQYVSVPASSSLDVGASANGLTVEGWINPSDLSAPRPIVEWSANSNASGAVGVHLYASTSGVVGQEGQKHLYANLIDVNGASHLIRTEPNALSVGTYQHVALTYDKTTGSASLYINGTVAATANLGIFTPRTNRDIYFGARVSNEFSDVGYRFP